MSAVDADHRQTVDDPCDSTIVLDSLKQRVIGYTLSADETPLCDYYMTEGWYSMGTNNVIAKSEQLCGTVYNWYLQGDLPTDDQITGITVCRNGGKGNICSEARTIHVKRCEENRYVFDLVAPDGCPEAYCIESLQPSNETDTPPDISSVKPVIEAVVVKPGATNMLNFFCDFTPPAGTNYFYAVEWGISTGRSWTHTIKRFDPIQYVSQFDFRDKTALTEGMLRDKNFGHLGITIACSVTAQHDEIGTSSLARESNPKFFGIEVLNKTIRVSNKEDTTIFLRITVPFGCADVELGKCSMDVNVFIPRKSKSCKMPDLSQTKGVRNRCGLSFRSDRINQWVPLHLTAFDGVTRLDITTKFNLVLNTRATVPTHPFFANYFLDPIKVEVHTDMTLLKNKLCYSHNDPHMGSFDGIRYENQNSGKFILYRNTKYQTQVQMQTTECYTNIWCNCGVVVNAGRDVFIVNNCGNGVKRKWNIRFRECQDRILRRKVFKVNNSKYEVILPTGTKVTIKLYGHLLNVDIAPGLADYLNTEGLCGKFDGDISNDRAKRPDSKETDPNKSWRVKAEEDLFDSRNDDNLEIWKEERLLCSCNADGGSVNIVDKVTCHPTVSKTCQDDREEPILEHQCSFSVRKRRNVHGMYVQKELDLHRTVETSFVSKRHSTHIPDFPLLVSKRMTYDYESAKADCQEAFNTDVFSTCSSIPDINLDDFIENCILDAQITNSMDWALTHLEALKDKCMHEIKVNQPLSADELAEVDIIVNNTVINTETRLNDSLTLPLIPTFSTELLETVEEVTCPNECNGNGKCEKGICVCSAKYIGEDCSVDRTVPPLMEGIPDRGECDLQFRECKRTSVFGSNLAETVDLTCHLVPFVVSSKSEIVKSNNITTTKGDLQTLVEVSCPLQQSRKKRSTLEQEGDYIASGYAISVSNDGVEYSEEDILVVFDSECVDCIKQDENVTCKQKPGYCVKNGQCYRFGETYGCNVCVGGTDNLLYWEPGRDCPLPAPPPSEPKNLWIIAAVVCPVVFIVVVIGGLLYYQSKRAMSKRKKSGMHSIDVPK
ncbi:von Willebrand factor D and EGF domain-containing protein-like [Mercenaria mercenaria]|uniref:von Willebrand factor D and EGF domain-containing protein-like n=1 Tax=Mercenaria mercenaria TaxID=6596 RepID=UPI00234E4891|nr:von Willebrand factor D and EGF domain-containing protein-like [Mercenaria mercenaria]